MSSKKRYRVTNKAKITITGAFITSLGIAIFVFGAAMFTYQGPPLNEMVSKAGMYSFLYWLPTLFIGIVIFTIGVMMKKKTI